MNESELEAELRRWSPAPPSPSLKERLAEKLDAAREPAPASVASTRPREEPHWLRLWLDRLLWAGLGATAVLVIMLVQRPAQTLAPVVTVASANNAAEPPSMQKVMSHDETEDWRDEGVRFDSSGQPVLKLRRSAVEHQAWADVQNAGVMEVEVPRQEIMYVPVRVH